MSAPGRGKATYARGLFYNSGKNPSRDFHSKVSLEADCTKNFRVTFPAEDDTTYLSEWRLRRTRKLPSQSRDIT